MPKSIMAPSHITVSLGIILLLGCHLAFSLPDNDSETDRQTDNRVDSNKQIERKEEDGNRVVEQSKLS